jgi:hypothetical protein
MPSVVDRANEFVQRNQGATVRNREPTAEERATAVEQSRWNDQRAIWNAQTGTYDYVAETDPSKLDSNAIWREQQRAAQNNGVTPGQPGLPTDPLAGRDASPAPPGPTAPPLGSIESVTQRLGALTTAAAPANPFATGTIRTTQRAAPATPSYAGTVQMPTPGGAPKDPNAPPSIEDGPPVADPTRINAILSQVNEIGAQLQALGLSDDLYSAAFAQLQTGLEQAQANALSTARSGNRRDRASNERLATFEQTRLSSQASQQAAQLRAQEEDASRQIKLDAFTRAGELGLNAGALDLDVQRLDMDAATNYLNQLFEDRRLGLQLDQAEAERVTNFVRDMALISKDYYALNLAERQSVRDALVQRYGIDQQVAAQMAQLDAQPGFWEQAALGLIGGAGQGVTMALGATLFK